MPDYQPTRKTCVGRCIYCRVGPTPEDSLQDEHIVPFGIEGRDVLLKASCKICAQKTSAFESRVLEYDLKGLRTVLDFPTRHRRRRPATLPVEVVKHSGEVEDVEVSFDDYPRIVPFPVFPPPAYLSKADYNDGIEVSSVVWIRGNQDFESIANKYDAKEMATYSLKYPKAWAQMLAKIAYAFAVQSRGLGCLDAANIYVLDSILGARDDIGRWVGCDGQTKLPGSQSVDHMYGLYIENEEIHVRVTLFSFPEAPEYHVVVGRLS